MKCPVFEISCLWNVLSMKYPVYKMSCLWDNLSVKCLLCNVFIKCPVYEIYSLWINILSIKFLFFSMKCPVYKISCLKYPVFYAMICPINEAFCLQNVLTMKFLVYEMFWNVLFIKYPVDEISRLCYVLSENFPVY